MFTVYCPVHGAEVLIWPSGIDAIHNRDDGIAVAFHCTCGHRGVWLTGRQGHERARTPGATTVDHAGRYAVSAGTRASEGRLAADGPARGQLARPGRSR